MPPWQALRRLRYHSSYSRVRWACSPRETFGRILARFQPGGPSGFRGKTVWVLRAGS